jgi:hypothetical protein
VIGGDRCEMKADCLGEAEETDVAEDHSIYFAPA